MAEVQREHLRFYGPGENMVIVQVSHEELLRAVQWGMPTSVYLDGYKIAGSVLNGMLKDALGLPIRNPRILDSERVFRREEERD